MGIPEEGKKYSWADMLSWPEEWGYELIRGEVRHMDTPTTIHQMAYGEVVFQIYSWLKGNPHWKTLGFFDVLLFASRGYDPEDVDTVLQPDLIVGERSRFGDYGYAGAPDLVVEILDPETADFDTSMKLDLYEAAGVREYWLLDPYGRELRVCLSEEGAFRHRKVYTGAAMVPVSFLDGLTVDLGKVFEATVF